MNRSDPPPDQDTRTVSERQAHAQAQFSPVARSYVSSTTHAQGADLPRMVELAALEGSETVLDVATGGGHMALALAPHARHVIASDLTLSMLQAAREHISGLGHSNVTYCRAVAEALPLPAASCHLVTCRVAAHHFGAIQAFVSEAARVLLPGGHLLISDHIGLDDPELDAFMDRFERWRDPSHVRAYAFDEWHSFCTNAGLHHVHTEDFPWEPYPFASWTERIRMPEAERDALEHWLLQAPARFRERFSIIEQNGRIQSLQGTFGILRYQKPAG